MELKDGDKYELSKREFRKILHKIDCKFGTRLKHSGWRTVLDNINSYRSDGYNWLCITIDGKETSHDYHKDKESFEYDESSTSEDEDQEIWMTMEEFDDFNLQEYLAANVMGLL